MDEVPPVRGTITREAIQAARAAFEQRARDAAATDERLSFDDIVIAHPVTHEQLERVPDKWLSGIRVMLCADGALVITKLETHQHHRACAELHRQVGNYAITNGMEAEPTRPRVLRDGSVMSPDVQMYGAMITPGTLTIPLAVLEVEVHHRCISEVIATAATSLTHLPSVVRVGCFVYFPP